MSASIGNKRLDKQQGLPATQTVVIASGWLPKEDWASMSAWLLTLFTVLQDEHGVALRQQLQGILLDGAPGAAKAVAALLPTVPEVRCLRNVLANARKAGGAVQGGCLAAEVQWTSHLPSRLLFHHIWCRVVQSALERGQDKLAEHMKTELLRKED